MLARLAAGGDANTVWSYAPRLTPRPGRPPPRYPDAVERYVQLGRALPVVRRPRTRRRMHLPRGAVSRPRVPPALGAGPQADGGHIRPMRRHSCSSGFATAAASATRSIRRHPPAPAARGFRPGHACGLPALRRCHGPHAANARHPARVAVGFTAGTWKSGVWTVTDRQARVGRGGSRVRLARVRSDAGPGDALCDLHARVGLR